jgi:uncharacterized Zn finger protein (UPF0148 family)
MFTLDGRCAACGTPCILHTGTEVCARCADLACRLWQLEVSPAWGLQIDQDGSAHIRTTDRFSFAEDADAAEHVVDRIAPPFSALMH